MKIRLFVLLFSCFVVIGGCGKEKEKAEKPAPKKIENLHKDIVKVFYPEKDGVTEILLHQKQVWNAEAVLFSLADDAKQIVAGMKSHSLFPSSTRVRFTASIPLKDKYGNIEVSRVLSLTYLTSDLERVNVSSDFLPQDFLNLYEKVWKLHPVSDEIIRAFCTAEIGKYARNFCRSEF